MKIDSRAFVKGNLVSIFIALDCGRKISISRIVNGDASGWDWRMTVSFGDYEDIMFPTMCFHVEKTSRMTTEDLSRQVLEMGMQFYWAMMSKYENRIKELKEEMMKFVEENDAKQRNKVLSKE